MYVLFGLYRASISVLGRPTCSTTYHKYYKARLPEVKSVVISCVYFGLQIVFDVVAFAVAEEIDLEGLQADLHRQGLYSLSILPRGEPLIFLSDWMNLISCEICSNAMSTTEYSSYILVIYIIYQCFSPYLL